MDAFRFSLTEREKSFLKDLVLTSIKRRFDPSLPPPPPIPTDKLAERLGAFVTLSIRGRLRGCIGNIVGVKPLHETIVEMAHHAAFQDPRFEPLTHAELAGLEIEISILGPVTPCPDLKAIEVGRHGLIVRRGHSSGLLLPQVAVDWKWDRETFLSHTCQKAGLPGDCWKQPDTAVFWFEAEVF
ncbi:MAG: AmmeMemoRadiSam system protein A [Desulfovibrionaceae bacterium]|nr:AmmeMemoRadiSam system protein A [Desulfovibrionaceae bacterium]MBF0515136.1 AmmeMemoRadiSam system protein A [Desulfovibrionaceae bacterium]